jgi:hypothetical protein
LSVHYTKRCQTPVNTIETEVLGEVVREVFALERNVSEPNEPSEVGRVGGVSGVGGIGEVGEVGEVGGVRKAGKSVGRKAWASHSPCPDFGYT